MKNLLMQLLAKRGIKDATELDSEERKDFDVWNKILSKEDLTLEDVKAYCQTQVGIIEGKWADYNLDQNKKSELIPYHSVYKTLLKVIDSPRVAREQLENQLNELLKK